MANLGTSFNSDFIFRLAEEIGILTCELENNLIPQVVFDDFSKQYISSALERDKSLLHHLSSSFPKFRCSLPPSKWAFGVAASVMWYYDEIIVGDPILQILHSETLQQDQKKIQLRNLLGWLEQLKESITGGFLLFIDHSNLVNPSALQTETDLILGEQQILDQFLRITAMGKKQNPINDDPADNMLQLDVQYNGLSSELRTMGNYIPPHVLEKGLTEMWFDFMRQFERTSPEELIALGKQDMLDNMKIGYKNDISTILKTVSDSLQMNTPVLFYREVDLSVAYQFQNLHSIHKAVSVDMSVYNYMVPYIAEIPLERVFEVRNQSPTAFNEFRWYMLELVTKLMTEHSDQQEIKYRIERDVQSKMRALTVEMENTKNKMRFEGVAGPLAMFTGSIGLGLTNFDWNHILSTMLTASGVVQSASAWAAVKGEKNKASLNSVYFLWKYRNR
jgi:hypothetical protein